MQPEHLCHSCYICIQLTRVLSCAIPAVAQALQYLDRDEQGQLHEHHKRWKEYYCVANQRLYYVNNAAGVAA
jgi:hypothetical protein